MNILHISDIHFRRFYAPGSGYKGMLHSMRNPLVFLDSCMRMIRKTEPIDLLVISGDLTEDGDAEDYALLRRHIFTLARSVPIAVTPGNHDSKANFRTGWLGEAASDRPYNHVTRLRDLCVISFDSAVQGNENGFISPEQLAWLKQTLAALGDSPSILVTHHHLLKNQSVLPEAAGAAQLLDVIRDTHVMCVLTGHTHHQYADTAAGKPYFTAGGMSFSGENLTRGAVTFLEKYGFNFYRVEKGRIAEQRTATFATGKVLATLPAAPETVIGAQGSVPLGRRAGS